MSSGQEVLAVVPLTGGAGEFTNVAALVFPAKQASCSPTNVSFAIAHGFLVHLPIQQHTHMVPAVDVPHGDFMLTFANDASLHANQLSISTHD